jgi:hypothetical protein
MSGSFADRLVARGAGLAAAPLPPATPPWAESSNEEVVEADVTATAAPATASRERPGVTVAPGSSPSLHGLEASAAPAPVVLEVTAAAPAPPPPPPAPAPMTLSGALVRRAPAQEPAAAPVSTSPPFSAPAPEPPSAGAPEPRGTAAIAPTPAPETRQAAQPGEGSAERSELPAASPGTFERMLDSVVSKAARTPNAMALEEALPPSPRVEDRERRPDPPAPVQQASESPPEPMSFAQPPGARPIAEPVSAAPRPTPPERSGMIGAGDPVPPRAVRIGTIEVRVESPVVSAAAVAPMSPVAAATPATVGFEDYLAVRSYAR